MKIQRQITSILSTMLIAGMFLTLPLCAQQSQTPAQQPPETAQQPQQQNPPSTAQPAQTSPAPANVPAQPDNTQPAAPAEQTQQNQTQQNQTPNQPQQNQPQQAQPQQTQPGTSVNPSQAPLAPVTTYPDASGTQQQQPSATTPAQTNVPEGPQPKKQQPSEPVGAAAAESVPTAGGAAAKPAGVAIAPAKQHQTRSWLIKLGAVVAAGAAVGTVYALSRGTSSTPPGATGPGVVQK
jgi:hypothetical protein